MGRQNEDAHKYVPEKMETFNDSKIVSVGMGSSFIGILCESKEEFKESEFVLKSGEKMTVQNKMNDVENRMAHNVFVQNQELFGDNDWIKIEQRSKYLSFPYFGHEFVDNLVMNKEQTMIELIKHSEIDSIYHSDIIGSMFFVSLDALNIIKTDQEKKEFLDNAQNYSFDKIEEIAFKIPENQKNVNIYVQPKNAKSIYLLKQLAAFQVGDDKDDDNDDSDDDSD